MMGRRRNIPNDAQHCASIMLCFAAACPIDLLPCIKFDEFGFLSNWYFLWNSENFIPDFISAKIEKVIGRNSKWRSAFHAGLRW